MSLTFWDIPGDAPVSPPPSVESTPTALDHVALGLSRLPLQFQEKPKIAALLTSWLNQSNELENAMIDVLTLRSIDTAIGTQLDDIGVIVGRERAGANDDTYRLYLRAQIAANDSDGVTENLIRVAQLVLDLAPTVQNQVIVRCVYDATAILEIRNVVVTTAQATVLKSMITQAASAGVRIVVQWSAVPLAQTFQFDVGPGLDVGQLAQGADALGGYV